MISAPRKRNIHSRPGVGASGWSIQKINTSVRRLVIDANTLVLVETGRLRLRYSDFENVATVGQIVYIRGGTEVEISTEIGPCGSFEARWVSMHQGLLSTVRSQWSLNPRAVKEADAERNKALFHETANALCDRSSSTDVVAVKIHNILSRLDLDERRACDDTTNTVADRLRKLFRTDLAANWEMEQVAQRFATSVPTLRRRLASEGVSFRELLQDARLSHSLLLLHSTDIPIVDIALTVGYDSASRFSARFRTRFDFLPSAVRGHERGRDRNEQVKEAAEIE